MSIRCPQCGREYDITLFQFGNKVKCDCGQFLEANHKSSVSAGFGKNSKCPPMKALVLYYSKTGNTKKIAEAITAELDAELRTIDDPGDMTTFDLICIGTPVYLFSPAPKMKSFLRNLPRLDGKRVAAFCTMAAIGAKTTFHYMGKIAEKKGARFIEGFACKASSGVIAGFGPKVWMKGRPDEEDLQRAREFAKKLATTQ